MVNSTDENVDLPDDDWLASIFAGQRELMEKYHEIEKRNGATVIDPLDFGRLDSRDVQARIKHLAYCVVEELAEATGCLKNKPWKTTMVKTNVDHFYEELADALHFYVELCITAGLDAEDLTMLYHRKHKVNQFRQRSGY
jgi:NTP pyrophosphatase (non-canonical NTP hydrolase)